MNFGVKTDLNFTKIEGEKYQFKWRMLWKE